ncbi:hypothetical protein Moror_10002 [Moniliophthora roreri MCA 2997]|uniref:DUF6534 domain-containing protein n=1 Tax=Moniliophthora roreri (strain MCA 2997) TaxID=1381753 RepID=V2WFG4_MONRO|nr:hypothetical protein Moror_10002 [Moniliophthora roreri MCA 2997]
MSTGLAAPLLLGYMLNWGLYGVLSVQVYLYWTAFPNDVLLAQILVYGLYLLETTQTVSLTYNAFQSFVFGFGSFASLNRINHVWLDTYLLDGLVGSVFQLYFANRIHNLLSRSKIIPGIIVLLSFVQLGGSICSAVAIKNIGVFSANPGESYVQMRTGPLFGLLWVIPCMVVDILIAVTMVYALSRYDTTFRQTRGLVRRLSQLAMQTGVLIAVISLIQPLFFFLFPGEAYHIVPALVIGKLYSNSLLVTFNSRIQIQGARGTKSNINVTPNQNQNPNQTVPLAGLTSGSSGLSSWVPSTFPSRLDWDMDVNGLMNMLDSKADTTPQDVASEPQVASLGAESKGEHHLSPKA